MQGLLHISVKTELAALLLKIQDYQILLMLRFNFLHPLSVSERIETRLSQKRSPEREQHKLKKTCLPDLQAMLLTKKINN